MELVITNRSGETIYKATSSEPPAASSFSEYSSEEDHAFWNMSKYEISMPGIQIGAYKFNITEEIHLQAYDPSPMPGLLFVQRGFISSKLYHQKAQQHLHSGQHAFLFNPFCTEDTLLKQQTHLSLFIVRFMPDFFVRLAEGGGPVMSKMSDSVISQKTAAFHTPTTLTITPKMYEVIGEINSCTYTGGLKKLFLEVKATELLTLQCAQIEMAEANSSRPFKLSAADLSKIHQARDILIHDIFNPPSLTTLARQTGLNEFKLKAGFRTVYSTSVFGYLNDYRLEMGKAAVLQQDKSLTEIAYESGYANLAHFSNAFKKKYGISPLKIRRDAGSA